MRVQPLVDQDESRARSLIQARKETPLVKNTCTLRLLCTTIAITLSALVLPATESLDWAMRIVSFYR